MPHVSRFETWGFRPGAAPFVFKGARVWIIRVLLGQVLNSRCNRRRFGFVGGNSSLPFAPKLSSRGPTGVPGARRFCACWGGEAEGSAFALWVPHASVLRVGFRRFLGAAPFVFKGAVVDPSRPAGPSAEFSPRTTSLQLILPRTGIL